MSMNNLKTQNVLRAFSFSFLILYSYQLSSFSFFISSLCALLPFLSGVVSLSQALCSSDEYSNSLLHLDLSKNPGVLSGEDASVRKHKPSGNTNTFNLHFFSLIRCFSSSRPIRRTFISSCLNPTAWSTWICRAQTAVLTQWVFNGWVWSNVCLWDALWYRLKSSKGLLVTKITFFG